MNLEKEMLKEYMSYNDNIVLLIALIFFLASNKNPEGIQRIHGSKILLQKSILSFFILQQHENMIREFQIKRSTKIIKREWKIFRFQLQMKRYVKEMKDRVLTRIQKVLRGFK